MNATPNTPEPGAARWIWPLVMTVFFGVMIGALIRLGVTNEETFHVLMREDAWAEWCTFLAFLTASVMAFDGMVRRSGSGLERVAFAGLGLFC
jgi:hypothetical protein